MQYQFAITMAAKPPDSPVFDGLASGIDPGALAFCVTLADGRRQRCDACAVGAELNRWP